MEPTPKKLEDLLVETNQNIYKKLSYNSSLNTVRMVKMRIVKTLNSMNTIRILLLIYNLWVRVMTPWYKCMKPFLNNLEIVINKYLCSFHYSFLFYGSSTNNQMLSGIISKCTSSYNYIKILLGVLIYIFSNDK